MSKKITGLVVIFSFFLASCSSLDWRQVNSPTNPPASAQGAAAYMDSSKTAVLFGGINVKWLNETWIWDGKTWRQVFPANPPPAREKEVMAYDFSRDRVVMFGGLMDKTLYDDTWEWDGQNWQLMNPAHKPPARCCAAMAYDAVNYDVLLYGGYDPNRNVFLSDVWQWDGVDWKEITCCGVPQMSGHAMADFPPMNAIISLQTSNYGTWSWDGRSWQRLPVENPPARTEGRIAFDSVNQRLILFGGFGDNQFLNDTWAFDGKGWRQLSLAHAPSARYGHVLFYDVSRGSIILFGGVGPGNTFYGDTWELKLSGYTLDLGPAATPSATPRNPLRPAALLPPIPR